MIVHVMIVDCLIFVWGAIIHYMEWSMVFIDALAVDHKLAKLPMYLIYLVAGNFE